VRFGAEYTVRPSEGFKLTATLGTNYATEDYMTSFFGVSGVQSVNSGLSEYRPDAGFKDVFVGANASIDLNDRWTLMLMGRYSRLIGDAADGPVVQTEDQFYGGVGLSYKFNWGR
jgi:outer membrane scaffolding protein for murein synthesis (MipA/OmpV family)